MKRWYIKYKGRGYLRDKTGWGSTWNPYYMADETKGVPTKLYSREVSSAKFFETKKDAKAYFNSNVDTVEYDDRIKRLSNIINVLQPLIESWEHIPKAKRTIMIKGLKLSTNALRTLSGSYWNNNYRASDCREDGASNLLRECKKVLTNIKQFVKSDKIIFVQEAVDFKVFNQIKKRIGLINAESNTKNYACNCCGVAIQDKKLISFDYGKYRLCKLCLERKLPELLESVDYTDEEREIHSRTTFLHNL